MTPKALLHGASDLFPDSVIQNSTEIYGEFRHPYQEAPVGSAGSFTTNLRLPYQKMRGMHVLFQFVSSKGAYTLPLRFINYLIYKDLQNHQD